MTRQFTIPIVVEVQQGTRPVAHRHTPGSDAAQPRASARSNATTSAITSPRVRSTARRD
jgi:hypothetical protein